MFPEQIADYLALVGDSSDNIPGIAGVGPKTAAKWLNQYQTLDGLIAHVADIGGKVGDNLRNGLEMLELSRKLATIDTALSLDISADELRAAAPNVPRLRELYTRFELRALLKALGTEQAPAIAGTVEIDVLVAGAAGAPEALAAAAAVIIERPVVAGDYHKIVSQDFLDAWIAKLSAAPLISFNAGNRHPGLYAGAHRRPVRRGHAGGSRLRAARARLCGSAAPARSGESAGGVQAAA